MEEEITPAYWAVLMIVIAFGIYTFYSSPPHEAKKEEDTKNVIENKSDTIILKSVEIGDTTVTQDNVEFNITSIEQYHNSGLPETKGIYYAFYLDMNNKGLEQKSILMKNIRASDQIGRTYYPIIFHLCDDKRYYSELEIPAISLKPDIVCKSRYLFETSSNSTGFNFDFDYTIQ